MKPYPKARLAWRGVKRLPLAKDWISFLALGSAIVGGGFAYRGLQTNTASLRDNIRGQIYAGDRSLFQREFEHASGTLGSIYVDAAPGGLGTAAYVRKRLGLIAPADTPRAYGAAKTAEELNTAIWGDGTYARSTPRVPEELKAIREAAIHVDDYFYHLATVYDYKREHVIAPGEWLTWRGWFDNVGPHPLLMMSIYSAIESGYTSRGFLEEVRDALCSKTPENIPILREYLGPKYGPAFVDKQLTWMPEYEE